MNNQILAVVTGRDMVNQSLIMLVVVICILLVWLAGRWLFPKLKAPAIVMTGWDILFVLLGLFAVINLLLSLIGHPLVKFTD